MNSFNEVADAYTSGSITFQTFAEKTSPHRVSTANRLYKNLSPIPQWYTVEDIEQDYLSAMHHAAKNYKPELYKSGPYLRYSVKVVIKQVQRARGVDRRTRKGPPKFERTFTSLGVDMIDGEGTSEHESRLLRKEYYVLLKKLCKTPTELAVINALEISGGTLLDAASTLYETEELRTSASVKSEAQSRKVINEVVQTLVAKYGTEEQRR